MSIATKVIESMTQMHEGFIRGVPFKVPELQKTLTAVSTFNTRDLLAMAAKEKDDEFRPEKITLRNAGMDLSHGGFSINVEYDVVCIERGEHVKGQCVVVFDVKKGQAVSYKVTS